MQESNGLELTAGVFITHCAEAVVLGVHLRQLFCWILSAIELSAVGSAGY